MKARKTLIRLHKWQADEKRKALSELLGLRDDLLCKAASLEASVVNEQAIVNSARGGEADIGFAYAAYAKQAIQHRENLQASVSSVEARIAEAEAAVTEAYQALKRHEIAAANQQQRDTREFNRKQQISGDADALQSHVRTRAPR